MFRTPLSQLKFLAGTIALAVGAFQPAFAQQPPPPAFAPQPGRYFLPVASNGQIIVGDPTLSDPAKPPVVSQILLDGHAAVAVGLFQRPSQTPSVVLSLFLINHDAPMAQVDDSKFFVLDGQGQQLRRITLDELKYSVQSWVAQNWRGANIPPPTPPPPQRQYIITGTQNGSYTYTELGSIGRLSGSSTATYTVQEQTNYLNQSAYMLGYSLGAALAQRGVRKHNNEIVQEARQTLASFEDMYFKAQSPIIPGEMRKGSIIYTTGSSRIAEGPFKVVLFLTDPTTGQTGPLTFHFR